MLRIFNLQTKHFLIIRLIKTIPSFVFNKRDQIIPQGRTINALLCLLSVVHIIAHILHVVAYQERR